jgi:hypothetical protein
MSEIAPTDYTGQRWYSATVTSVADWLDAQPKRSVPWAPMGVTYQWARDVAAEIVAGVVHSVVPVVGVAVADAVSETLPEEWHVLPDGRATHAVMRRAVLDYLAGR